MRSRQFGCRPHLPISISFGEPQRLLIFAYGETDTMLEAAAFCLLGNVLKHTGSAETLTKSRETLPRLMHAQQRRINAVLPDPPRISDEV